jgi:hypothetical protein
MFRLKDPLPASYTSRKRSESATFRAKVKSKTFSGGTRWGGMGNLSHLFFWPEQ